MKLHFLNWCLLAIFFIAVVGATQHVLLLKGWMLFARSQDYQIAMRHRLFEAAPDASIAFFVGLSAWGLQRKSHLSLNLVRGCLLITLLISLFNVTVYAQPLVNWPIFATDGNSDYQTYMWAHFWLALRFAFIGLLSCLSAWHLRSTLVPDQANH